MLIQRPQGVVSSMTKIALVLASIPRGSAGDVLAVLFRVPGELLVRDDSSIIGTVDDLVDLLSVQILCIWTRVGFQVVDDSRCSGMGFLAERAVDAVGSMSRSSEMLREISQDCKS